MKERHGGRGRSGDGGTNGTIQERRAGVPKGWSISRALDEPDFNVRETLGNVTLTKRPSSAVVMNVYAPGEADEMHCHPDEDHVFLVWKGVLHLTGVEEGEDVTLYPGEFVHIDQGYYYRLHNPGPEVGLYFQVRTLPDKPAKRRKVFFSESARGKAQLAAAQKPEPSLA
jgi:mannose-6-phosphate isomerase-like protein (cupin superfamily)